MIRIFGPAALCLFVLAGCGLARPDWEHPRSRRVGPVTFVTDGDESVLDLGEKEWNRLLTRVRTSPLPQFADCSLPVTAYLFSTRASFEDWAGDNRDGVYDAHAHLLYAPPLESDLYKGALRHELFHHLHTAACTTEQPLWLKEGLAQYMADNPSTAEIAAMLASMEDPPGAAIEVLEKVDVWFHADYQRSELLVRALLSDPRSRPGFVKFVLEYRRMGNPFEELCAQVGLSKEEVARIYERERDRLAKQPAPGGR